MEVQGEDPVKSEWLLVFLLIIIFFLFEQENHCTV